MTKKELSSPTKASSKVDKLSSDENSSPVKKPTNSMMMNWLSKSASKKIEDAKAESKSTIKTIDNNCRSVHASKKDHSKVELKTKNSEKLAQKPSLKKKLLKFQMMTMTKMIQAQLNSRSRKKSLLLKLKNQ